MPQNRERIYTIGCLRTKCSEKVFSFSGSNEKDNLEGINPKCLGGFGVQNSNGGTQFYQQDRIYDSHTVATSLTNDLPGGSNYYAIDVDSSKMNQDYQHQQEGIHDSIGIASTICARDYKDAQKVAIPIQITPPLPEMLNYPKWQGDELFDITHPANTLIACHSDLRIAIPIDIDSKGIL